MGQFNVDESIVQKYLNAAINDFILCLEKAENSTKNIRTASEEVDMLKCLNMARTMKEMFVK